jgi:hypothetical protein
MVNLHKNTIMIVYFIWTYFIMQDSEAHSNDSSQSYYALHRVSAVLTHKEISESKLQDREIGTVLSEHENSLIVVAGENRKEHVYLSQ